MTDGFKWYCGTNDEYFEIGPLDSREEAISEGEANYGDDGFHIIEAKPSVVTLSVERMIENQYFEDEDWFCQDFGSEQDRKAGHEAADLELQEFIDDWLIRHKDTFVQPTVFAASRNGEYFPGKDDQG